MISAPPSKLIDSDIKEIDRYKDVLEDLNVTEAFESKIV
jgi:hypothetical protein